MCLPTYILYYVCVGLLIISRKKRNMLRKIKRGGIRIILASHTRARARARTHTHTYALVRARGCVIKGFLFKSAHICINLEEYLAQVVYI